MGIFILFIAIMTIVLYAQYARARRRTKAIQAKAQQLGMEFRPADLKAETKHLARRFAFGNRGRRPRASNVMVGQASGLKVHIFDFKYTRSHGSSTSYVYSSVVVFIDQHLGLPQFSLRPEYWTDRVWGPTSRKDIDFEDSPEFSRAFHLEGEDEAAIRSVFTPALRKTLVEEYGLFVEVIPDALLFARLGKRSKPDDLDDLLREAMALRKRLEGELQA